MSRLGIPPSGLGGLSRQDIQLLREITGTPRHKATSSVLGLGQDVATLNLKGVYQRSIDLVVTSVDKVGRSLEKLQGQLGPISIGFDAATVALKGFDNVVQHIPIISSILGPFTAGLSELPGLFKGITATLTSFAQVASPGQFYLWQVSLKNVQGVIGQTFVPALEVMREGVQLFGDVLANILPNTSEARDALGEFRTVFMQMGQEIRAVLQDVGPAIRDVFIGALRELGHWLAVAARAVGIWAHSLRGFFGTHPGQLRSAVGAAAQPAHIEGVEEYRRRLQLAAFAQPGGLSVAERQLNATVDMARIEREALQLIHEITAWGKWLQGAWNGVVTLGKDVGAIAAYIREWIDWWHGNNAKVDPNFERMRKQRQEDQQRREARGNIM